MIRDAAPTRERDGGRGRWRESVMMESWRVGERDGGREMEGCRDVGRGRERCSKRLRMGEEDGGREWGEEMNERERFKI